MINQGTPIGSGSFFGRSVQQGLTSDQTLSDVGTACQAKGLKKLTFGLKANKADLFKGTGIFQAT